MKPPKPKINDLVETLDLSKLFGRVVKIISNNEVLVEWDDKIPKYQETENIKNLALVKR